MCKRWCRGFRILLQCPESEIRFILRLARERISDSKDTSKSKILVWFWFGSPLDERAAMKRTAEPPH